MPGAGFLGFNDYKIHVGDKGSLSLLISLFVGLIYHGALIFIAAENHGWIFSILSGLVVAPWLGFSLDRLRESTEHLHTKSDVLPEARELGNNVWSYLIGGGPWGQPCHLSHHLAPGLPWYQQLRLSKHIERVLSAEQRAGYFIAHQLCESLRKT